MGNRSETPPVPAGSGPGGRDFDSITTAAQLLEAARDRKRTSGLTFRQLTRRARTNGDVLPHSTLAATLSRQTLPRAEVLSAFIRACGGDESEVAAWLAVRDRIAAGPRIPVQSTGRPDALPLPAPQMERGAGPRRRVRRRRVCAALGGLLLVALVAEGGVVPTDDDRTAPPGAVPREAANKQPTRDASVGSGPTHCTSDNPWGSLCISVTRSGTTVWRIEGSVENATPHCSMALMVSGTSPDGKWFGSAKRTPCGVQSRGVHVHRFVWNYEAGRSFRRDTKLCVQAGIYTGAEPNPTDWNRNKSCVWLARQ
ncbi:MAG TPA: hypothetical protein VFY17_06975 [Pilimelia sp.]|nr:hypothetical protein [Pilimelia sp.]